MLQEVDSELEVTMTTGLETGLTKSCGKDTGIIGEEVMETQAKTAIISVDGQVGNCPDPIEGT